MEEHTACTVLFVVRTHPTGGGAWACDIIGPEHIWHAHGAATQLPTAAALAERLLDLVTIVLPTVTQVAVLCNDEAVARALHARGIAVTWDSTAPAHLAGVAQRVARILGAQATDNTQSGCAVAA